MYIREIHDYMTTPCIQCDKPIDFNQIFIKYDQHWTHTFCDMDCFIKYMFETQTVYQCRIIKEE